MKTTRKTSHSKNPRRAKAYNPPFELPSREGLSPVMDALWVSMFGCLPSENPDYQYWVRRVEKGYKPKTKEEIELARYLATLYWQDMMLFEALAEAQPGSADATQIEGMMADCNRQRAEVLLEITRLQKPDEFANWMSKLVPASETVN